MNNNKIAKSYWRALLKRILRSRIGGFFLCVIEYTPFRNYIFNTVYDPHTGVQVGGGDMARDWDERARRNAKYFIAVDSASSDAKFWESGITDLEKLILRGLELPSNCRALEIGCGIGRLARPLSKLLSEVHGVDISNEMIRRGKNETSHCSNLHLHHIGGDLSMFDDSYFDFCYSYRVFQHIPTQSAVREYWQEIGRVLRVGGVFRFQICITGPQQRRAKGGTWFGALFTEADVRSILSSAGFAIKSVVREPTLMEKLWKSVIVTCLRGEP